ncbi:hypothetical protein CLV47_10746 [Antricoccus suffuscus]|uniref:Uncharacterized protein n=1 Tax=Antricoccus suffuscus TaxID=1629062 RepID=A0A2T0ZZZ8_9ACTN|nr:hypothetical protein [Antricoccus suffuscus]PRZ41920.1 hypothetical protein CLV47_10746 [Antricoccus suffuscus]
MGRFIVAVFVIIAIIPAVVLARLWFAAAGRRTMDYEALSFLRPTAEADATMAASVRRRGRSSYLGVAVALVVVVIMGVYGGESTVFFWIPTLVIGGVFGVLIGTAVPLRVKWKLTSGKRPINVSELGWAMRVTALVGSGVAVVGYLDSAPRFLLTSGCTIQTSSGPSDSVSLTILGLVVLAWLVGEAALLRLVPGRRIPVDGADVMVDDAARSAIAHTAVGAVTLLSLGSLAIVGIGTGLSASANGCGNGAVGAGLLTLGLAAAIAAVLIAGFLIQWGIQLRKIAEYVHRAASEDAVPSGR